MEWLNYHHLFYFHAVAREGSIAAACRRLLLTPATISAQVRKLESRLGQKLFKRAGRSLALTEFGRLALRYADEIFRLGDELVAIARGRTLETSLSFRLGIDDVLPKPLVGRLLAAVFGLPQFIRTVCVEGTQAQLLPQLAVHDLDLMLSDAPADPSIKVRAFSRPIGSSPITLYAAPALARRLRQRFPAALSDAPALLPTLNTSLRSAVDAWLTEVGVRPRVVAEFEDMALLADCAQRGMGFCALPEVVAQEFAEGKPLQPVGAVEKQQARFYAITVERQVSHPAALALIENASAMMRPGRADTSRPKSGRRNGGVARTSR